MRRWTTARQTEHLTEIQLNKQLVKMRKTTTTTTTERGNISWVSVAETRRNERDKGTDSVNNPLRGNKPLKA